LHCLSIRGASPGQRGVIALFIFLWPSGGADRKGIFQQIWWGKRGSRAFGLFVTNPKGSGTKKPILVKLLLGRDSSPAYFFFWGRMVFHPRLPIKSLQRGKYRATSWSVGIYEHYFLGEKEKEKMNYVEGTYRSQNRRGGGGGGGGGGSGRKRGRKLRRQNSYWGVSSHSSHSNK